MLRVRLSAVGRLLLMRFADEWAGRDFMRRNYRTQSGCDSAPGFII